ncbi:MAG: aldolase [Acetobacteraceae bacterium]|nr:aldolase [Acetobacteraceae bacterium]
MPEEDLETVLRNNVAERLAAGEVAVSMAVRLVESVEIAQIAKTCGYDSLYIDIEHCSMSLHQTGQICVAALGAGITPFVRVPSLAPEWVSRVLDAGAMGVIAPHVRSAEEARAVVAAAKFPPFGHRSVGAGLPQLRFRSYPLVESRRLLNERTTVLTMIESPEGLEHVEEIAAVDGVDILFIGTNDLCAELGIDGQFEHPLVREAYERTIAAARRHGKHVGIGGLAGRPKLIAEFVKLGARYVSAGSDLSYLMAAAQERCRLVREFLAGEEPAR